jgi:hypothetical protein
VAGTTGYRAQGQGTMAQYLYYGILLKRLIISSPKKLVEYTGSEVEKKVGREVGWKPEGIWEEVVQN